VVVVALTGEHDLASRDELREEVEQALTTGRGLVVDLTRASFIDSVIAAVLLEARKTAKRHDLGLAVLLSDDPSNDVRRMFELSRLTTIFEIFPSRAEAISAVRGGFVQSA
jgi:anti-sigma B factor antagonist